MYFMTAKAFSLDECSLVFPKKKEMNEGKTLNNKKYINTLWAARKDEYDDVCRHKFMKKASTWWLFSSITITNFMDKKFFPCFLIKLKQNKIWLRHFWYFFLCFHYLEKKVLQWSYLEVTFEERLSKFWIWTSHKYF